MKDIHQLVSDLRTSTDDWTNAIQNISDEAFNRSYNEKWSPAQIVMHVILSEKGVNSILIGPSQSATNHNYQLDRMDRELTNFEKKVSAPKYLEPRIQHYDKEYLIQKFKSNRTTLEEILLNSPELENIFTSYSHLQFGLLTGYEWAFNVLLHANRHFKQLQDTLSISES